MTCFMIYLQVTVFVRHVILVKTHRPQRVPLTTASGSEHLQPQMPGQPLTQQIYIPNDMVGAIIGKGGAKINEIRQLSGSVIKINEPTDNSNERLVTITGTQECNQMALYMLYSRLGKANPSIAILTWTLKGVITTKIWAIKNGVVGCSCVHITPSKRDPIS